MRIGASRRITTIALALAVAIALTGSASSAVAQPPGAVPLTMSPALPAAGDAIQVGTDLVTLGTAGSVQIAGPYIILNIGTTIVSPEPPAPLAHLEWSIPPLPAGLYTIEVGSLSAPILTQSLTVRPQTAQLGLIAGRFLVTVTDQQGGASPAAVALSDSGGYFTFFDPTNVELTVKIVDGTPVNNHWWIFVASMTNTGLSLTVTDTQGGSCASNNCPSHTYTNPPNTNQNFIDLGTF
ncbi:MAG TPA: hypothetical protein VKY89_24790 [Thermoanaerobaculia bacterium]|nr:hypothetical protein [Thermoanaerobaculia bacterium]